MSLNNTNWTEGSSILHPLTNLPGIQSSNKFNIAEVNKRIAIIRNNHDVLLNTLSTLAEKIDGAAYFAELIKGFSEIIYSETFKYDADKIALTTNTKHNDITGTSHTFRESRTPFHASGVGSLKFDETRINVFLDGKLLSTDDYKLVLAYGSASVYIKTSLIKPDNNVSFFAMRKYNQIGKTFDGRAQRILTAASSATKPYVTTLSKSHIGIVYDTNHIIITEATTGKVLKRSTDYTMTNDPTDNDKIIISIKKVLSNGTVLKLFNATEFGQYKQVVNASASSYSFKLSSESDNTILPVVDANSVYVWVNGLAVDSNLITHDGANTYTVNTTTLDFLPTTGKVEIVAFKSLVYSTDENVRNVTVFPPSTLSEFHKYLSISEDLDGKGMFVENDTIITHGGKLITDYSYAGSGDRIQLDMTSNDYPIIVRQGYLVSESHEKIVTGLVKHIQTHNGWIHTQLFRKSVSTLLSTMAYSEVTRMNENVKDIIRNVNQDKTHNDHVTEFNNFLSHTDKQIKNTNLRITKLDAEDKGISPEYRRRNDLNFTIGAYTSAYNAEVMRLQYGTGLVSVRSYDTSVGFDGKHRTHNVASSAMFQHTHDNYYSMVGLGELAGIANGFYFRTGHNDPTLRNSVNSVVDAPDVPASIKLKPTGLTLEVDDSISVDTSSDTQAKYIRNIYTDNIDDCRLDLMYLEVWLEKLNIDETFDNIDNGIRHSENAETFLDSLVYNNKLNFAGVKDPGENTSFRGGIISTINDNGLPEYAYTNYRIRTEPVGTMSKRIPKIEYKPNDITPEITLITVNAITSGTHGHTLSVPLSFSDMNTLTSGTKLYIETSIDKSYSVIYDDIHTHLIELSWNGATIESKVIGTKIIGDTRDLTPDEILPDIPDTGIDWGEDEEPVRILTRELDDDADTDIDAYRKFTAVKGLSDPPVVSVWRNRDGVYEELPIIWQSEGLHTHSISVFVNEDRYPFDLYKAVNHIIDDTNRWKLIKDYEALNRLGNSATWKDLAESNKARWILDQESMDSMISNCWGLDGEGAYIIESVSNFNNDDILSTDSRGGNPINMAKYNRQYYQTGIDAGGRALATRGFNDPTLYVSRTTKPEVVEGYSYLIPLEVILRTPSERWNPFNIPVFDRYPVPNTDGVGTKTNPRKGAFTSGWYSLLPPNFFSVKASDPADSIRGSSWAKSKDGIAYPVSNSGIAITLNDATKYYKLDGIEEYSTIQRLRYVVAPDANLYTHNHVQLVNIKDKLKELLKLSVTNTLTDDIIDSIL